MCVCLLWCVLYHLNIIFIFILICIHMHYFALHMLLYVCGCGMFALLAWNFNGFNFSCCSVVFAWYIYAGVKALSVKLSFFSLKLLLETFTVNGRASWHNICFSAFCTWNAVNWPFSDDMTSPWQTLTPQSPEHQFFGPSAPWLHFLFLHGLVRRRRSLARTHMCDACRDTKALSLLAANVSALSGNGICEYRLQAYSPTQRWWYDYLSLMPFHDHARPAEGPKPPDIFFFTLQRRKTCQVSFFFDFFQNVYFLHCQSHRTDWPRYFQNNKLSMHDRCSPLPWFAEVIRSVDAHHSATQCVQFLRRASPPHAPSSLSL